MNINPMQLQKELAAAGFEISGCNSNGIVWDAKGKEIQSREEVKAVLMTHKPTKPQEPQTTEARIAVLEAKVAVLEKLLIG